MKIVTFKGILAICVIVSSTVSQPLTYPFVLPTSAKQDANSSQEKDLINYDSAKCVCDITHYKDFDCGCDLDTESPGAQTFPDTSRKFTIEQDYLLKDYPFCDTLRDSVNSVIPSQINNIACLAYENTPYHGNFFDANTGDLDEQLVSMTAIGGAKGRYNNYNISDFLQHYSSPATIPANPTQLISATLKYAPDYFGFCRLVPIIKPDMENYSHKCRSQAKIAGTNELNNKLSLSSDGKSVGYNVISYSASNPQQDFLQIEITQTSIASPTNVKDQGYSYGDFLQTTTAFAEAKAFTNKYKFGGIFYLEGNNLIIFKLKVQSTATSSSKDNSVQCTGVTDNKTQQYIIYYTTIGSDDNTSYQITHCTQTELQSKATVVATNKVLVSFTFLSYTDILQEKGYGDRLSIYVKKLFYPLEQFLSGSILTLSLYIIFISILLF